MENERQKMLDNLWVRVMLTGISVVIFFVLCYFLRGTLISLLLAFISAYIVDPAVDFFERRTWPFTRKHIHRGFGIVFIIIIVLLTTAGFLSYAIPKTVSGVYQVGGIIKNHYPKYQAAFESWIETHGDTEFAKSVKSLLTEIKEPVHDHDHEKMEPPPVDKPGKEEIVSTQESAPDEKSRAKRIPFVEILWKLKKHLPQVMEFLTNIIRNIFYSTFGFFGIILNFIIFSVVSVYLLKDFNIIAQKIKTIFPLSKRDQAIGLLSRVNDNLRCFLRGQLIICLILSLIYSIGLTIAGIPLSFLIGFIGGFGNLIPYVGTGTGIILASTLALFHFHDFTHIAYVILTFGIGQMLEGTVITPRIMGKGLGLSPVMVILSILICSQLFGFLGLLLAVPIASTVKVFVDEIISKYKSSEYYKG
ncbi:MAG: AI-2E family transporter [Candidatus Brocadia sp.]|nr:AI-2E family transporter [Candidatus Brocadia sp.]